MKGKVTTIIVGLAAGMLLLGGPAWAHHMENENEEYSSLAGDEQYFEEMHGCMEQIDDGGDLHCYALYGHWFDLLNKVPINIQRPSPDCESMAYGFTTTVPHEDLWSFARMALESSPGFVEYKEGACDDPRIHPERGLTSDVLVSQDVDILGYWHLSADQLELTTLGVGTGPGSETPSMGVLPCLTVNMVLETGRHLDGSIIAEGSTTKTIVSTPHGQGMNEQTPVPDPCPEAEGEITLEEVHEVEVNLGKISQEIPKHEGFVVGVTWYLHEGTSGDPQEKDNLYHREWNMQSGPDYPNRIIMALEDSIRVEGVRPQLFDGKIYVHSVLNSPWGSYDVDTANIRVEIEDEAGEVVVDQNSDSIQEPILRYSLDHDGHFRPVNATFPWDFSQDDLEPGEYTIRVTATNWQHTSDASREASFTIREDRSIEGGSGEWAGIDDPHVVEESSASNLLVAVIAGVALAGVVSLRRD